MSGVVEGLEKNTREGLVYIPNLWEIRMETYICPPTELPRGWKEIEPFRYNEFSYAAAFVHNSGLRVFCSLAFMENDTAWLHLSCSRKDRLPTWDDIKGVRRFFTAYDKPALQVFPVEKDYVNIHKYCLHIWQPVEVNFDKMAPQQEEEKADG